MNSAGRFSGILIYRGVIIAPVQRFNHSGTGYHRILSELVCPVYRDEECGCESVCGKETLQGGDTGESDFLHGKVRGYLLA